MKLVWIEVISFGIVMVFTAVLYQVGVIVTFFDAIKWYITMGLCALATGIKIGDKNNDS